MLTLQVPLRLLAPFPCHRPPQLFGVVKDQSDVELENLAPAAQILALDAEDVDATVESEREGSTERVREEEQNERGDRP
jgi:hypothetical protein